MGAGWPRGGPEAFGRLNRRPILLRVVLHGYQEGILSSRSLAEACRRNVVLMALSADMRPHFTTLADLPDSNPRTRAW